MLLSTNKLRTEENKEKSYPLHKAIRYRSIYKIKRLLESVKDINEKNDLGYPPLLYACEQENNDEMLELLFDQNNLDPFATDNDMQNALHILAFHGKLKWIKTFFDKFPNFEPIDMVTSKGNTPLMMAAIMDHPDIIEYLFKKGADINHRNDKNFTALHYAANNGHEVSAKKLLVLGADKDAKDTWGCTPLMKACGWGFIELSRMLLNLSVEIDVKDSLGSTALAKACRNGCLELAELLLQSGASPNCVTKTDNSFYTPISFACKNGNINMLKLLIKYGGNVNYPGNYSHALFHCINFGFIEGVEELIKARVDLHGQHPYTRQTPFERAMKYKKQMIARLIQKNL